LGPHGARSTCPVPHNQSGKVPVHHQAFNLADQFRSPYFDDGSIQRSSGGSIDIPQQIKFLIASMFRQPSFGRLKMEQFRVCPVRRRRTLKSDRLTYNQKGISSQYAEVHERMIRHLRRKLRPVPKNSPMWKNLEVRC